MDLKIKLYWSASGDGLFQVRTETVPATESHTTVWDTQLPPPAWRASNPYLRRVIKVAQAEALADERKRQSRRR